MSDWYFVERGTLDLWDDTMRDQRNRIKELESERDELRSAIFGSEDYASDLRNGNFREMARMLHAAQKGGLARAEIAEAKLAKVVEAANFLSDRLNEFDLTDDADDMCRNFIGHIEPAHARMCAAIAEINGGGDE